MVTALLLIDHGSRRSEANEMLLEVAAEIRSLRPELIVEIAHMELAEPTLAQAVALLAGRGVTAINVHPYMLSPGRHATDDIPGMVNEVAERYPEIEFSVSAPLGVHRKIAEVVLERTGL